MIEQIKKLLNDKQYSSAKEIIDEELSKSYNLHQPDDERVYSELLHLRVVADYYLGVQDPLILDDLRHSKFPSVYEYTIAEKHKITLLYKNSFKFNCDALVGAIEKKDGFINYPSSSSVSEFVRRLGRESIYNQIDKDKVLESGDYIILNHPNLSTTKSYHIALYDNRSVDLKALESGIKKVLDDCIKKQFTKISFFALGFDQLAFIDNEEEKQKAAHEIAGKIAQVVVEYIYQNQHKNIPEIFFNFVRVFTISIFSNAFNNWGKLSQDQIDQLKLRDQKTKNIINEFKTRDPALIGQIKDLSISIDSDSCILITGETGVGKSFLAERVHYESNRRDNPIVKVNCALIKESNIYTTLFGWKRGSFTDAKEDGVGAIEKAEGGTLFLDEIGYSDTEVQSSLLHFVENRTYTRFGDSTERKANVRIVFGTNVDLQEAIREKQFYHDFFERIAQVQVEIPPLRKRIDDIENLANSFLEELNANSSFKIAISSEGLILIKSYKWPGNVRQLKTFVERLFNFCKNERISLINSELIKSKPPRDTLYFSKNPYQNFEVLMTELLKNWKGEEDIISNLIKPVLAKVWLDDLQRPKKDTNQFLGMDSSRGNQSTLMKMYNYYHEHLKNKHNLG